jgi:hypothetical protein
LELPSRRREISKSLSPTAQGIGARANLFPCGLAADIGYTCLRQVNWSFPDVCLGVFGLLDKMPHSRLCDLDRIVSGKVSTRPSCPAEAKGCGGQPVSS